MTLQKHEFNNKEHLNQELAERIIEQLEDELTSSGTASLAVSGGSTPVALFTLLSQADIEWDKVNITLVDERWVEAEDSASNSQLVLKHLIQNKAEQARFVSPKTEHASPYDIAQTLETFINIEPFPFTVLILGMGEDGHTASLFPCAKETEEGLKLDYPHRYLAVTPMTAPHDRMSLSLASIVASKHIYLHITGDAKQRVLQEAMDNQNSDKPIKNVIENGHVQLFWAP